MFGKTWALFDEVTTDIDLLEELEKVRSVGSGGRGSGRNLVRGGDLTEATQL